MSKIDQREKVNLKNFQLVCRCCGAPGYAVWDDNAACGDDKCCGPYREWPMIFCSACGAEEPVTKTF